MHSSNSHGKVLIAAPVHEVLTGGLEAMGYECVMATRITQQAAPGLITGCVGVITSTRLQFDRQLLDAAPHLRWIGRMGSGMEVIDVPYALSKGIACHSSPEGNCNAVGEHALGMLLSLVRRISWAQQEMKDGVWKRDENRGAELEGKTIGIIGYGHTGAAFAKKLQGFDMRILAYDKYFSHPIPAHIITCQELRQVFEEADIVSFHVPLQPDTMAYCDEVFIKSMHKSFILINTSRGPVVDTLALHNGLLSGKVSGACLDVFEDEPITTSKGKVKQAIDSIMRMPNVVVTPHIAGYTFEALYKMSTVLLEKVSAERKGNV